MAEQESSAMAGHAAIIHPSARLGEGVEVGPWSIIGPNVEIGDGTRIDSHVVIRGNTRLGKNNRIFQFASIGEDPSDMKFKGEETWLEVGDDNVFREGANVHRGTGAGGGITRIGSNNLFMPYTHVAHDCIIGNHVIMANYAGCSGHAVVDDWAILGGYAGIYQFVHVGAHSFIGAQMQVNMDVPAYIVIGGLPAAARNVNVTGLQRRGFSDEAIKTLRQAFRIVYRDGLTLKEAIDALSQLDTARDEVAVLISSLQRAKKGIIR